MVKSHLPQPVQDALAGKVPYDSLTAADQEIVRGEWDASISVTRDGLDYEAKFTAEGRAFTEADHEGRLRRVDPNNGPREDPDQLIEE